MMMSVDRGSKMYACRKATKLKPVITNMAAPGQRGRRRQTRGEFVEQKRPEVGQVSEQQMSGELHRSRSVSVTGRTMKFDRNSIGVDEVHRNGQPRWRKSRDAKKPPTLTCRCPHPPMKVTYERAEEHRNGDHRTRRRC